ncbi:MAG TPA: hypothetical protein VEK08_16425 [Planctomycetota bacterium]|nr:hypothetical protein [Planctomycetota bacterium]
MTKARLLACAVVCLVAMSASAGDAEKKKTEKVVVKKEEKKESTRTGGFKGFWIHSVGGTIGNGLKSGAKKIGNTFD